jgi:hypothetical protein
VRATRVGFVAAFCIGTATAIAQPIPGADDPYFMDAVADWLEDEDPAEGIWELGEIAQNGNIAAQLLVNRIYRLYVPWDFPSLNKAERRELLPPDVIGFPPKFQVFETPFRIEQQPDVIEAEIGIQNASTFEEWRRLAERLQDAGMDRVLSNAIILSLAPKSDDFNIEVARYAENNWPLDAKVQIEILWFRFFENLRLTIDPETHDKADDTQQRLLRWGGEPWRTEDRQTLGTFLREGRWRALERAHFMQKFDPGVQNEVTEISELDWAFEIMDAYGIFNTMQGPPPTSAELSRLGSLVIADAARTPDLYPLATVCARHCDGQIDECAGRGALTQITGVDSSWSLEPVISDAALLQSKRGESVLMMNVLGYLRAVEDLGRPNFLPQCLISGVAD